MKILADENIERAIIEELRKANHQVIAISEISPRVSDSVVFETANTQKALLLTADKDFGDIVYRQKQNPAGVLLIRLSGISTDDKIKIILSVITDHGEKLFNAFTVVTPKVVRIRPKSDD